MNFLPKNQRRTCEHQYMGARGYILCHHTENTPFCWYEGEECILDAWDDERRMKTCRRCGKPVIYINERRGTSDNPYPIDCDGEVIAINREINLKMRRSSLCEACVSVHAESEEDLRIRRKKNTKLKYNDEDVRIRMLLESIYG